MSTGGGSKGGTRKIDEFISSSVINPFISTDLKRRVSNAIEFLTPNGARASGYEAIMRL